MDFKYPEIVSLLKQQRRFHREQLELIDMALAAIEIGKNAGPREAATEENKVKKHRIQWTKQIDGLLENYNEFTIMDLQNDLAENRGIATAMTIQGRNVIHNTLNRFQKKGRIQKISPGVYQVVREAFSE
jgi:hypothetical protein